MIKKVTLRKFKKFKSQEILLNEFDISLFVGGNNSGKSTIIQALTIWEFCKSILKNERGISSILLSRKSSGYGLSIDEFVPIALPTLNHLWTNLKTQKEKGDEDGYTLRIGCTWDTLIKENIYLEFGLSLSNDRLFIKTTDSNLVEDDILTVPSIAFLPTFAGINEKEKKVSFAERSRQIGKGLAGSVIRNILLDMYNINQEERKRLKGSKSKISDKDLKELREKDPWEILQYYLRLIFNAELLVKPFNENYHTYINIEISKGEFEDNKFVKYKKFNKRDIMVEGSGFLQWLSVLSLALTKSINVLLLDEPDAHLHPKLQIELLKILDEISKGKKQILISSHSTEIIKSVDVECIFSMKKLNYINSETERVGIMNGIGSEYAPKINQLQRNKRLLIVENESDAEILKNCTEILGKIWPQNITIWASRDSHKDRKHLFLALKQEISDLKAISLRDRDEEPYNTVDEDLTDKSISSTDEIMFLKWKRRHIEGYLLIPSAISRITSKTLEEINRDFIDFASLVISGNILEDVPSTISNCEAKEIITRFERKYGFKKAELVKKFLRDEICKDIKTVIDRIIEFAR